VIFTVMANGINRRTFVKTVGTAGVAATLSTGAVAGSGVGFIDGILDTSTGESQEAIVVFESNAIIDSVLGGSVLGGIVDYYAFDVLPIAYVKVAGVLLEQLAALDGVLAVTANRELEYLNADTREVVGTNDVQAGNGVGAYDGSSVHVAVVDSGIDGDHPDFSNIANNYRWLGNPLGNPTLWVQAGSLDTDSIGHGTHVSGTIGGDGTASGGKQRGHAPGVTLTSYSSGLAITILKATAAYDHLLANHPDVQVVSNSYGSTGGGEFDPNYPLNVATRRAYNAGILPVFAAGNAGPDPATLNPYAKAPYVLGVGATNNEKQVVNFSSRGDPDGNFDRQLALSNLQTGDSGPVALKRPGVGAPGKAIVSTMSPADALNLSSPDLKPYYASISGTSMSCPCASGIVSLVIDAYQQNGYGTPDPIAVLNTIEATTFTDRSGYSPINIGAGFVDAVAAVSRAEEGDLAGFDEVNLA
jgi:serine protease AprX